MDIFQKCADAATYYAQVRDAGIYPYYRAISSGQDPVVTHLGKELVMLGSNNYLGLTNHPEVKEAATVALAMFGTGCAGSRLLNGTLDIHLELEERLAKFLGREDVLTFSTGFQVNLGVLSCLLRRSDVALLDGLNHASLIDGCRLSFGKTYKYQHNDMADLEKKLSNIPDDKGKLIAVDGVFSMEGDTAKLPEIVELKNRYGARLLVDDAHGLGVFGENGRGTPEYFGIEDEVDLLMGTFSKSLATVGGFIAGSAPVIDFIRHEARSAIFSAAPPPASMAAAIKALEIVEREPERRKNLWENARFMKREFSTLGFDTGESESPVIPLVVGEDLDAYAMTLKLQERGVFANPVVSPAVPKGRSMMRTSYMATHTAEHLDIALEAFAAIGREMGIIS
ncbi:MAG: aminotransferase class I/II-fold pyridoxal phosphate-dependent enzyme [Deltaproteobacteria bacterium]|nr:aminotransferase class I/II-fold pyridoxal phosphate-dependent enzyme [Deltaproteobacteria bacterium]